MLPSVPAKQLEKDIGDCIETTSPMTDAPCKGSLQNRLATRDSVYHVSYLKLEIFIPETHLSALQSALKSVDAGHIGKYDSCLSYSPVMGTWRPLAGTTPYIGTEGQISCEPELKVEVTIQVEKYKETMAAIKHVHPYEEPVINAIPLWGIGFS